MLSVAQSSRRCVARSGSSSSGSRTTTTTTKITGRQAALVASSRRVARPLLRPTVAVAAAADNATNVAELALGSTALLAALTFGVAPRFRQLFKEDVDWKQIFAELREEGGVETVSAEEAARLIAAQPADLVALDVRPEADYSRAHAPGAVNVPLYLPIQKWDAPSIIRRAAFAFFGIAGTEPNPSFDADALAVLALQGKKRALVICATGGSLTPKEGAAWGFSSRSLKAVWRLRRAGAGNATRLVHVSGGMRDYLRGAGDDGQAGLDFATVGTEGEFEEGQEEEALAAMRAALGVKRAAAAGAGASASGERGASPVEGVLTAVRGLFGGGSGQQ